MISPFAPWYRRGTVNVTQGSQTVTGVDTAWAYGTEIREGDLFVIDGLFYEVAGSPGATQLTLRTPYTGTTKTDAAYAIIRNFAVTPGTTLITRTLETMFAWKSFQDQMYRWQTEPYNAITPSTIEFTNLDGQTVSIKSLPQVVGETNITARLGHINLEHFGPAALNDTVPFDTNAYWKITVDKTTTLTFNTPTEPSRLTLALHRVGDGPFTINLPGTVRDNQGAILSSIVLSTPMVLLDLYFDGVNYYKVN